MNNAIPFRAVLDVLDRLESEAAGGAPRLRRHHQPHGQARRLPQPGRHPRARRSHRPEQGIHRHAHGIDHAGVPRIASSGKTSPSRTSAIRASPRCPEACPYSTKPGAASAASASAAENRRKTPNSPNVWPKSSWERDRAPIEGTAGKGKPSLLFQFILMTVSP